MTLSTGGRALRSLLSLALPIIGVNLGLMLMGVVDTIMVGRVSAEALAAVALGNVYYFALVMAGVGVLLAVDPVIAQAVGARDHDAVARGVQRGMALAAILSIPLSLLLLLAAPVLRLARQPEAVIPMAGQYCLILIPGVLPFLLFNVGRQALQAMGRVVPILWTIVIANLTNLALNYLLIRGRFGFPALGVSGSALATTISRALLLLFLLLFARQQLGPILRPFHRAAFARGPLIAFFKLGLPIGIQMELEIAAFSVVALLMGRFGTVAVAGHQIAINLASLTFMVPMGVGMGAAVTVGHAVGRGDVVGLRAATRSSLIVGAGFMACMALLMIAFPLTLARFYTIDREVAAFAASLLPIAGVFQIFDGIQVVSAGVLRGLGDTRAPMLINLVGFCVVGISASLWLAYRTSLGAVGLWWGLVIGLAAVAGILLWRVRVALSRPLRRVGV